eukprot:TRINITY_DN12648_c1_g2_i19.p2 TRINITY_DN12648_c1_g2~~TRINITY_DN12648_c1_g2_i19.p2  ORF type:complete len:398 (+),score=39.95 TRINITY_DN12648_c1_g2_i19:4504-5697(+)
MSFLPEPFASINCFVDLLIDRAFQVIVEQDRLKQMQLTPLSVQTQGDECRLQPYTASSCGQVGLIQHDNAIRCHLICDDEALEWVNRPPSIDCIDHLQPSWVEVNHNMTVLAIGTKPRKVSFVFKSFKSEDNIGRKDWQIDDQTVSSFAWSPDADVLAVDCSRYMVYLKAIDKDIKLTQAVELRGDKHCSLWTMCNNVSYHVCAAQGGTKVNIYTPTTNCFMHVTVANLITDLCQVSGVVLVLLQNGSIVTFPPSRTHKVTVTQPLPRHFKPVAMFACGDCVFVDDEHGNRLEWQLPRPNATPATHLGRCLLDESGLPRHPLPGDTTSDVSSLNRCCLQRINTADGWTELLEGNIIRTCTSETTIMIHRCEYEIARIFQFQDAVFAVDTSGMARQLS